MPVVVAVERFDLRIPGCASLKQKRHVLKTLDGRAAPAFAVSVAEVDHQDLWQRRGDRRGRRRRPMSTTCAA